MRSERETNMKSPKRIPIFYTFVSIFLLVGAMAYALADRYLIRHVEITETNNAIFAVNGDYYDFRSDGIVIRDGVIFCDIPARTGLAFYSDGTMKIYDETKVSAQALLDAGVWNTLSFGPCGQQSVGEK